MVKRVAVIGAGSWGTALAVVAARAGHEVHLWSRNEKVVDSINRDRLNSVYLTATPVPPGVTATADITTVAEGAGLVILAAPSHATRGLLTALVPSLRSEMIVVSATKGIEIETGKRISQVFSDVVPESIRSRFVCLSGPSFAREVVERHPTAVVAASEDSSAARRVQSELSFDNLRIYTNNDVTGTEVGGSVKNVMAIAAGMVDGLGFGSNSIAALITRGLAEMTRLGLSEGARLETLMGLAGLGDLVLTCTGSLSRNRFVGHELGRGRSFGGDFCGHAGDCRRCENYACCKALAERLGRGNANHE